MFGSKSKHRTLLDLGRSRRPLGEGQMGVYIIVYIR